MLASLDHPSIVPAYDVGKTEAGQPYIVSKLIDGGSLAERAASSTWSIDDSARVVCQLAHAMDYLHHQGIMHRDIEPSNILTTANGDAVLAEFGETDAVIDGLNDKWGRSVQTAIISLARKMISSDAIVSILRNANGVPLQCALVSTLGSFPRSDFNDSN